MEEFCTLEKADGLESGGDNIIGEDLYEEIEKELWFDSGKRM